MLQIFLDIDGIGSGEVFPEKLVTIQTDWD